MHAPFVRARAESRGKLSVAAGLANVAMLAESHERDWSSCARVELCGEPRFGSAMSFDQRLDAFRRALGTRALAVAIVSCESATYL
jgi:hypothetical protein